MSVISLPEIEKPRLRDEDLVDSCFEIVLALPEYFDESAHEAIPRDLVSHDLYVARESGKVVGFATVERKNSRVAEISWLAVSPNSQGRDLGSALLVALVEDLEGVELLEVKTLAEEAVYAPYEDTRRFYEERGFALVETIDPYPGWPPGNPCAVYVRALAREV